MRLGRIREGKFVPNNVCALAFATDPRQVFAGAYVHFLRYNGTDEKTGKEYNVIKDRMIDGTVLDVIRDTASTLDANLREFTEFKSGKFFQAAEYPHDAWYRTNSLDSEAYKALGEALSFSLDADERRIVNYVIEHSRINASDALRILSTTYWHTASGKLKRLAQRGVLDFVSKKHRDPKSHYVLHRGLSDSPPTIRKKKR